VSGSLLLIAAAIAPAAAQTEKPTPGATKLTVVGCLTRQPAEPASASQTARFLLTPEQPPAKSNTGAQPQSGGAVPAPPHRTVYVVRVADGTTLDLATAVGKQVRVVGTSTAPSTTAPLAGRSPEATPYQAPVAAPSGTQTPTGTPFDTVNLPTLVVTSMTVQGGCR
jgi:hypothetical protein